MGISIFREIYKYEDFIKSILFSNQELLKYLYYPTVNEPLNQNDIDNPYDLIDNFIYFKPSAIDDTTSETKSFLLVNLETRAINNSKAFARSFITFDIIVHKDINEIIVNGEDFHKRTRDIVILLDEAMNGKDIIGTCQLEYEGALAINNKNYISRRLVYHLKDLSGFNYKGKG